jgi:exodeoxyribonuclease VII large subunit
VAAAIRSLCAAGREGGHPDVVIVGRGGGSAEDLWAFNEEPVVRAIFGCPVPVISAVGHETDVTLADLVADVRAATPSAAAELAAPDRAEIARAVALQLGNAEYALARRVERASDDIRRTIADMTRGLTPIAPLHRRIAQRAEAMRFAALNATSTAREQTSMLASQVEALSPHATLGRGYALVSRADGSAAPIAASVAAGDAIDVRWRDGSRRARVESGP